ncbi:integrase core domain-containing protein, partial [Klebsiella pneumoniae]|uniref:integrase core domain-containing protein n=3 Tax=Klebsiella TaxID=570 RepID=UPI00292B1800
KRAYCLKTQPATGETYPKSDLFNKADECLNEHWFSDIVHARKIINDWRLDYNECRPHSSLNYLTPAEFAAGWRNGKYEEKPTDITN